MKRLTIVIVLTLLIFSISGFLIKITIWPTDIFDNTVDDPVKLVHHQKQVLPLFENVCADSDDPVIRRLAMGFTLDTDYTNTDVVTNLRDLKAKGLLSKAELFSEYNADHMNELKIIYEVLYYAKNFDAFYKTAAWARQNVNCGLYINAVYMAMQNRKDTERLIIPAPYELLPNYFIRSDVVAKASSILAGEEVTPSESIRDEGNEIVMDANYTANFYDNDDETKLAYFCEDIGLNTYYFLRKLKLAPWLNIDNDSSYGENMYQMMRQFVARYNLERYANGLPVIESLDWRSFVEVPYDPLLVYSNGNEFPCRLFQDISHTIHELLGHDDVRVLETMENNITTVVRHMRQSGYNKTQILNHLMEILVTSDRSYETLARRLLGKDIFSNEYNSVLDHYMTSLRDPMFWKITKKIVDLVDSALEILPPYSRNELYFPGVDVMNVEVKNAMTVFDYFEVDVTDALKLDDTNSTFRVKIGQPRLNHKPFTIKLNVSSLVASKGLVKIYLGPKILRGQFLEKKNLLNLYDTFEVDLIKGTNIFSRSSEEIKHYAPDFMSLSTIRKKIWEGEYGFDTLPSWTIEKQVGYPSRLTLPKGTAKGLQLQLFVFIAPFYKSNVGELQSTNTMEFNSAILSPGYPIDLITPDELVFSLSNSMTKYIYVTHKEDGKVENYGGAGIAKKWYSTNSYDPLSRPSNSGNSGNSLDFSSKKDKFVKGEDLTVESNESMTQSLEKTSSEEKEERMHFLDTQRVMNLTKLIRPSKSEELVDYTDNDNSFDY